MRDGGGKHLMSAQPSSAHYTQKEPLLQLPDSKPHSVQHQDYSAPPRTYPKGPGPGFEKAPAPGDYLLITAGPSNSTSIHFHLAQPNVHGHGPIHHHAAHQLAPQPYHSFLLDQTMSEYTDKQERPGRPARQAQSHRKEARFEYPHLNFPPG